jgi:hypothetical protein
VNAIVQRIGQAAFAQVMRVFVRFTPAAGGDDRFLFPDIDAAHAGKHSAALCALICASRFQSFGAAVTALVTMGWVNRPLT